MARKVSDEQLKGEIIFHTLNEAKIVKENWRQHYITAQPQSSLGNKTALLSGSLMLFFPSNY
jgi:hypothetical protein